MTWPARGAWIVCFALCALCALFAPGVAQAQMVYAYGYIGKVGDHDNYLYALVDVTMAILGPAHDLSQHLRPIAIPVDKGLVGYRMLMVRRPDLARFAGVHSLADLKPIVFGLNFTWDDVDILRADGIFWKYHRPALLGLDLAHRRVSMLDNPFLPVDTPSSDARLWLTAEQLRVLGAQR